MATKNSNLRIGLYPGMFDPMTLGHMDIIQRAVKLVDHLVIGIATDSPKKPLFTLRERAQMLRRETAPLAGDGRATISVESFDGLLVHFAKKAGASVIIRGLRAVSDFEYEFQMVGMNQRLAPEIETVFLMADPRHQAIASRLVKEIAFLGGDISHFVSPNVAAALNRRVAKKKQNKRNTKRIKSLSNTIHLDLEHGQVVIELRPDLAPNHVTRIKELASEGFYDGVVFHRVIPGFMAQTGDPTGTGTGGSDKPNVAAEFSEESHVRGTVSMARSSAPDSANSQFFICFADCPWLDGQYSVFGKVVSGMEHVDAIKRGAEGGNGEVSDPDSIKKMSLAE